MESKVVKEWTAQARAESKAESLLQVLQRQVIRLLELAKNLGFAQDHRIQPAGDGNQNGLASMQKLPGENVSSNGINEVAHQAMLGAPAGEASRVIRFPAILLLEH